MAEAMDVDELVGQFLSVQISENVEMVPTTITVKDVCCEFRKLGSDNEKIEAAYQMIKRKLRTLLIDSEKELVIQKLSTLYRTVFKPNWTCCRRVWNLFETRHSTMLGANFLLPRKALFIQSAASRENEPGPSQSKTPQEIWSSYSIRHQNRKRQKLDESLQDVPFEALAKSFANRAAAEGKKEIADLTKLALRSPSRAIELLRSTKSETNWTRALSPESALAFVLDMGITKEQYKRIYELTNNSSKQFQKYWPSYDRVVSAKTKCRPFEQPTVSDDCASVSLQSLLEQTTMRLVDLQRDIITRYSDNISSDILNVTLELSWGFDGSSGHSMYNQRFNAPGNDQHLFATTVIPLEIKTQDEHILWRNKTPQSVRFCRPLKLQFIRETNAVILKEREEVQQQIEALFPINLMLSNKKAVCVKFKLNLTVIDGKVWSVLSGAKSQMNCGICDSTPKNFNQIEFVMNKPIQESNLSYGISPLHLWIRSLEFLLHLSYKNAPGLRHWRIPSDKKTALGERKQTIQEALREKLNLIVDVVKPVSGTTNNGNTARRAFCDKNRKEFAKILEIDYWLIEGLHNLLCAIDSCLPIDADRFGRYTEKLARRYAQAYGWYYMPVSIHRLLIHGKDIIKNATVPLGMLSEQAGESRNKLYRRYREIHARKNSRVNNLLDLFNRCMDTSDPIMSQFSLDHRVKNTKKIPLPLDALNLLQNPLEHLPLQLLEDGLPDDISICSDVDDSDDNSEDDTELENEILD